MHCSRNSVLTPFLHCTARARVCGRVNHKGCLCSLMLFCDVQRILFEILFSLVVLTKNIRSNGLCLCFLYQRTDCTKVLRGFGNIFLFSYDRRENMCITYFVLFY